MRIEFWEESEDSFIGIDVSQTHAGWLVLRYQGGETMNLSHMKRMFPYC